MLLFRKVRSAEVRSAEVCSLQSAPRPAEANRVEYVVRPCDDTWLIDHAGASYGPYKNGREAMLFAVDAARKLGALGKNTGVKMIDNAGHLLTTWNYDAGRNPAVF